MQQGTLRFVPTKVSEISKSLGSMFDAPETSEYVARASEGNFFVVGVKDADASRVSEFAGRLSAVHRARFFIVVSDRRIDEITAEAAAVSLGVNGDGDANTLEIVRLRCPENSGSAVASILRANSIPGFASTIYVWDWKADSSVINAVMDQADSVMFDSGSMQQSWDFLYSVIGAAHKLVDINWIRLGAWREQIRGIFERPTTRDLLPQLRKIAICCVSGSSEDPTPFMLAGWAIDRLRLEPIAWSPNGFECRGRQGEVVTVVIQVEEGSTPLQVREVFLGFEDPSSSVRISKTELFEIDVTGVEPFTSTQDLEADDFLTLIERYFLLGEATRNYGGAVSAGRQLYELRRGFRQ